MSDLKQTMGNPWDFTLYVCGNGDYIIKVIFSEGQYKVDVARFFFLKNDEIGSIINMDELKIISETIRENYSSYKDKELTKGQFDNLN